ncbi:hypothetical protein EB796_008584 [Bugula neritina]|uniref:Uncharacterized protein n=1 Tax=Bugula neritina TaxID=10212 RepID=A0A7J7K578_BUGNE|nr:hypothetical protein EB796_008584 [Bugula neritina]
MTQSWLLTMDTLLNRVLSSKVDLSFDTQTDDDDMTIIADGINYVAVDVGDLRDFDSESDITIAAEETTYNSVGESISNVPGTITHHELFSVPSTSYHTEINNNNNIINSKVASEIVYKVDNESKALATQIFSPVKEKIITVDYPQVEDMTTYCLRRRLRNAIIEKVRNIRSLFTVCFRPAEN